MNKVGITIDQITGKQVVPRVYDCWRSMRVRCYGRSKTDQWFRYRAKNIQICDAWMDYETFRKWAMSNGFEDGLSIDRIDNDGDYCPENCHFITRSEHAIKTRTVDFPDCRGSNMVMAKLTEKTVKEIRQLRKKGFLWRQLAEKFGVGLNTIRDAAVGNTWRHVD